MAPQQTKDTSQLDRIEAKLDEVLAFRDALLKFMMPKMPAVARTAAMALMTRRAGD